MHRLLTKIVQRQATLKDLEQLEELCDLVKHTSLCGLGQTAPNPVVSTFRYFKNEYLELLQPAAGNYKGDAGDRSAVAPVASSTLV
jgi:bidirectional [NiFe] hydrogenase diaphorase subunit